jgi:hypothetical protein
MLSGSEYVAAGGTGSTNHRGSTSQIVYTVIRYAVCDFTERDGAMCHPGRNTAICTGKRPADDATNRWRPYEIYRSDDGGVTWDLNPTLVCLNAAVIDPAPPPITATMVKDHALALLPSPTLALQPDATALLGVPVIAATPTVTADPEPITLLGRTVRVRAQVDTYRFDFGDGATVTGQNPGHGYTDAAPCTPDDCDAYIHHTYVHPGVYTTSLTATWHAQFQVDGGSWQDIPGTLDTASAARALTVIETTTVLITGS